MGNKEKMTKRKRFKKVVEYDEEMANVCLFSLISMIFAVLGTQISESGLEIIGRIIIIIVPIILFLIFLSERKVYWVEVNKNEKI